MLSIRCPFILSIALAVISSVAAPWIIAVSVNMETGIGPSALIDPGDDGQLPMWLAHEFTTSASRTILAIPVTTELQRDAYITWRGELLDDDVRHVAREIHDVARRAPRWSDLHHAPAAYTQAMYEYRVGWPLLALGSRVTRVRDPDSELLDDLVLSVEGGIPIKEVTKPTRTIRNLPFAPLWGGLLGNAVIYWIAWMLVIIAVRRVRSAPTELDNAANCDAPATAEPAS